MSRRIFLNTALVKKTSDRVSEDGLSFPEMSVRDVVLRIFNQYLRRHIKVVLITTIALIFVAATTGALPFLMQNAADEIFVNKNGATLYLLPFAIIVVMAARSATEYLARVGQAHLSNRMMSDLRVELFQSFTRADLAWLQSSHSGHLVSIFMRDVLSVNQAAMQTMMNVVRNSLQVIILIGAMFYMDWILTILVVAILPFAATLLRRQRKRFKVAIHETLAATGDLNAKIAQVLTSMRVVKAYTQEEAETNRAKETVQEVYEQTMRAERMRAMAGPISEGLSGIGLAAAVFYGGWRGMEGSLSLGEFMGFMTAAMLIYQPVKALVAAHNALFEGVVASSRVFGVLDLLPAVSEKPNAAALRVREGGIRFNNVTFGYDAAIPVLKDFNLDVKPGQKVALVGPSGAGKSTVLNMALRFYDPQSGSVQIDGQDLKDANLKSVRAASALLTQDPVLFDDTIAANIAYGIEASDSDIRKAAHAVAAEEFIEQLADGFDTSIGEAGNQLSGGQKQRVAFARAILKDAPIVLLDEPTSALDAQAEARIQEALDSLLQGRTVLMIAHRLATIQKADLICVMDAGHIVEQGTHDELVARGGLYSRLHAAQFLAPAENETADPDVTEEPIRAAE